MLCLSSTMSSYSELLVPRLSSTQLLTPKEVVEEVVFEGEVQFKEA